MIDAAITEILRQCAGVDGRIFQGFSPESAILPAVSYFRMGQNSQDETLGLTRIKTFDYQIRVIGTHAAQVAGIADAIESFLYKLSGAFGGENIKAAQLTNRFLDFEQAPGARAELLTVTLYK